jgi:hypothetical protein
MNESDYLRQQADHALTAMKSSLRGARRDAAEVVDPRGWVKSHPWPTVAVAAVTGLLAGIFLERRPAPPVRPAPPLHPDSPRAAAYGETAPPSPGRGEFIIRLFDRLKQLFTLIKPLLEAWVAAQAATNHPGADGHESPPPPQAEPFSSAPRP